VRIASTGTSGRPHPRPRPCATPQAIRRPVKEPGPQPKPIASIVRGSIPASCSTASTSPSRWREWPWVMGSDRLAEPPGPATATEQAPAVVSSASTVGLAPSSARGSGAGSIVGF
jgi:hypothetical protein